MHSEVGRDFNVIERDVMIPDEIRQAAQLSDALYIAQQALHLTASARRDIVWTVADGRQRISSGESLPSVAAVVRAQGAALVVSFSRGEELLGVIKAGMGLMGFDAEVIQASYGFILQTCVALQNTAVDGSELAELFATVDQSIAAPPVLF